MWHQLEHDKSWVKDGYGYHCKYCGKVLENKMLRKFCPTTNCEREYNRLFVQYDCWAWFRERVFNRDNGKCVKCGRVLAEKVTHEHGSYWTNSVTFVCDHIVPLFKGGKDWYMDPEMVNFQTLCEECNKVKTAEDLFVPKTLKEKARQVVSLAYLFEKPVNYQLDKFMVAVQQ